MTRAARKRSPTIDRPSQRPTPPSTANAVPPPAGWRTARYPSPCLPRTPSYPHPAIRTASRPCSRAASSRGRSRGKEPLAGVPPEPVRHPAGGGTAFAYKAPACRLVPRRPQAPIDTSLRRQPPSDVAVRYDALLAPFVRVADASAVLLHLTPSPAEHKLHPAARR